MKKNRICFGAISLFLSLLLLSGFTCFSYAAADDVSTETVLGQKPEVSPELLKKIESAMVRIPEGPVYAGVKIHSFMLSKYEVTQGIWTEVMGYNPSEDQENPDLPVTNISWGDAKEFIKRLNDAKKTGDFRLPTSIEWEYACRAGAKGRVPMQANAAALSKYAWWSKNSGDRIHPVGRLKPNAWGIHDILGNVEEWLENRYESELGSTLRYIVGGHYNDANLVGQDCSPSGGIEQEAREYYIGMRLAKSAKPDMKKPAAGGQTRMTSHNL